MFYSLKCYITVMYPETEGFGLKSPISKKIAQQQDSHIQNPTLVIMVMFALYAKEQIY